MGGSSFVANCRCGYESRFMVQGRDESQIPPIALIPVVCLKCRSVFGNEDPEPRKIVCPSCQSTDVAPMARIVMTRSGWENHLISGPFPCPDCGRWAMRIREGQWD